MGISCKAFETMISNKKLFEGKRMLSLGNPFFKEEIFKKYIGNDLKCLIMKQPKLKRSKFLFNQVFSVDSFYIMDFSKAEDADFIEDLNEPIQQTEIYNSFDIIFDGGTQEHVFNTSTFFVNIFSLLKNDGIYMFDLPANNYLEHGFRQYSPTFFYDFCYVNNNSIELNHLTLHWKKKRSLNVLPIYHQSGDNYYSKGSDLKVKNPPNTIDVGKLTNYYIMFLNKITKPILLLGCISKKSSEPLKFSAIQSLYRNHSIKSKPTKLRKLKKQVYKMLPSFLAIRFLEKISKVKFFQETD